MSIYAEATPKQRGIRLFYSLIECPNKKCGSPQFTVDVYYGTKATSGYRSVAPDEKRRVGIGHFTFAPATAQPLSAHVPAGVVNDYNEAYLIARLSPKASATLARRALQGMVRDFFQVVGKRTLHAELEAIKDRCDPALYDAMMAVKSVGNIGAHPEQDISLIVDVELGEAETLLELIHLLDREWYVARADRLERIAKINALAANKAAAGAGSPQAQAAPPSASP
ncbi:DUF4145 domain-containing protein [Variovorax sp. YR750]|uniref:DUF4145 domain-containing protein n=1 Tax=Variovorax sp. YR750 TaxID=1884384 RepID=UPI000B831021|nr:DUF4145 domain-containing protein [Variovorax sp. YR750]